VSVLLRQPQGKCICGNAQIGDRVFPVRIQLDVDGQPVLPPHYGGAPHGYFRTALAAASMKHEEGGRVFAEIEVSLGVGADSIPPSLLKVAVPRSQPVMPVIDASARRWHRVELNAGIAERNGPVDVSRVEQVRCAPVTGDVLLRHRPRSIPQAQESA
jgi:hypothetical protein